MSDSSTYNNDGIGFTNIYGISENPTVDSTQMYDSDGTATFVGTPTYSELTNGPNATATFFDAAEYFHNVTATNQAAGTPGSTDFAIFYDVGVASTFNASQGQSYPNSSTNATMFATGANPYSNQVVNFSDVIGIASNAGSVANLYDNNGTNAFISTPTYATFSPPSFGSQQSEKGFDAQTEFFQHANGYSYGGSVDAAYMYGDDSGQPGVCGQRQRQRHRSRQRLRQPRFAVADLGRSGLRAETYNFPVVFDVVYGSNNTATLYDDTLATQFFTGYFPILQKSGVVTQDFYAAMSGLNGKGNYDNQAVGYQTINIVAVNNKADAAILMLRRLPATRSSPRAVT